VNQICFIKNSGGEKAGLLIRISGCVCMREREREINIEKKKERKKEIEISREKEVDRPYEARKKGLRVKEEETTTLNHKHGV
jgi:hypothetical protein